VIVRKAFRYRIYPSPEQALRLDAWSAALRFLWNIALEQRHIAYAHPIGYRTYPSAFDQANELTGLRADLPWLADVPRNVSTQLLVNLDAAWQRCFKRLADAPRWKRKGRDVIGLTEPHPKVWRLDGDVLHFPKIGPIHAVIHRPLEGTPKTCTVKRDGDQWFAAILCEIEVTDPVPSTKPPIGIDLGCVNLLADSNGRIVENPRHLRAATRRLARAQRTVFRRKKGSRNREKAKLRVARLHRKVRRQRDQVLHTESKFYANNHGLIFVEKLQIGNMSASGGARKRGLNRSILSAGWGHFVDFCRYKVVPLGGRIGSVPAPGTSQECNVCGVVDARSRISQSVFCCVACGNREHADTNAAKNILGRGLTAVEPTVDACAIPLARSSGRQELRVARRGTRPQGLGSSKAPAFRPG